MLYPYGELIIFGLLLLTWSERSVVRDKVRLLTVAWILGKGLELGLTTTGVWHWHWARLAVVLVFGRWAYDNSDHRIWPIIAITVAMVAENLFNVNEPGLFPFQPLVMGMLITLVAWLVTQSYWGMAAALSWGLLIDQAFVLFLYKGIMRHIDLPDEFFWNYGVICLVFLAVVRKFKPVKEHVETADAEGCVDSSQEKRQTGELDPVI